MTKEQVIKIRDNLRCGEANLPVRVHVNNSFSVIDESLKTQFTIWDDDNEILYSFKLPDPTTTIIPSNVENCASVYATPYGYIEAIELPLLPIDNMRSLLDKIPCIEDQGKVVIEGVYRELLSPELTNLGPADMNRIMNAKLSEKDDYYNGKMSQSFNAEIGNVLNK